MKRRAFFALFGVSVLAMATQARVEDSQVFEDSNAGPTESASRSATADDLKAADLAKKEAAQADFEEPIDPASLAALQAAHPAWPMHKIDNTLWNHNSLSPGDVNRDGFTD